MQPSTCCDSLSHPRGRTEYGTRSTCTWLSVISFLSQLSWGCTNLSRRPVSRAKLFWECTIQVPNATGLLEPRYLDVLYVLKHTRHGLVLPLNQSAIPRQWMVHVFPLLSSNPRAGRAGEHEGGKAQVNKTKRRGNWSICTRRLLIAHL